MIRRCAIGFVAIVTVVAACSQVPAVSPGSSSEGSGGLTIFAAASLKNALADLVSAYEAVVPGAAITVATDSSSTLRTQIEQGGPADLFLSADQKNPQVLVDAGLTDGPAEAFAGNTLTIIVPTDNPANVQSPADLGRPGVNVIAAGDDVPIATYTKQVIANLAAIPGYSVTFASNYSANVVSREQNVTAVVAKIELGEGDAAIVYVTDANASTAVETVTIPTAANVPATYAAVVLAASTHRQQARAFLDWLASPAGSAILARFGFQPPP